MLTFEYGKMKMMRLENSSVTLILPLGHLNINIYGKIYAVTSQHNGVFSTVPQIGKICVEAHQGASVPLGRRERN